MSSTPKTSTAIASLLTLFAVAVFFRQVPGSLFPAVVGIVGALSLTGSLWIADAGSETVHRVVASLLSVPIAGGFVVGVFGTALVLTGSFFPVEEASLVSVASLLVVGNLGLVVGSVLAIFGVTLGANNVLTSRTLRQYTTTTTLTAVPSLLVGLALVAGSVLAGTGPFGRRLFVGEVPRQVWTAVVAPDGPQLHLSTFLVTLGATGLVVALFVRRSPFEAVVADWDDSSYRQAVTLLRIPRTVVAVTTALLPVAVLFEFVYSPAGLRGLLSAPVYGFVQTITTAGWIRLLLVGTTVVVGGWLVGSKLLSITITEEQASSSDWLGPLAVGVFFTVIAAAIADTLFEWVVDEVASQLPPELATQLLESTTRVQIVYGTTPVVVFLTGIFLSLAAMIGLCLRLAVGLGYLTEEGTGFSVATSGMFLAAISAAIVSAPSWLVFGAVVTGLAIWDIGHFGTELGREVANGASRQLITVRAGATVLVGGAGVGLAFGLQRWLVRDGVSVSSSTTLALLSFVTALVAFAIALR